MISPILFGLYLDQLLDKLKKSGNGCHIGTLFTGAMAFAGDISLLAPSRTALQKMLPDCVEFSNEYNLNLNPKKANIYFFQRIIKINVNIW